MASLARKLRRDSKIVGLVPTMGALHDGHLSLIKKAKQLCDVVVVSVFVNPAQFNEDADYDKYPRDITADSAILANLHVDYVFAPAESEIYGEDFSTFVTVDELSNKLEGASRPGHFRGVATIVAILFNTIRPEFAFFGQKDAQQVAVIKRLTADLGFETEIIVLPIVREKSGLAMSSRNDRLTPDEREAGAVLKKALDKAETEIISGETNASTIAEIVRSTIEKEPLARLDYVAVVENESLEPIDRIGETPVLIAVAAFFGEIRLIDNVVLGLEQ